MVDARYDSKLKFTCRADEITPEEAADIMRKGGSRLLGYLEADEEIRAIRCRNRAKEERDENRKYLAALSDAELEAQYEQWVKSKTVEAKEAETNRVGELTVHSTPSRAGVTVNGIWRGRTPLALNDFPFGTYAIAVVSHGYEVSREEVTLSADEPSHIINVQLKPASTPAQAAPRQRAPARATPRPPVAGAAPALSTGAIYLDSRRGSKGVDQWQRESGNDALAGAEDDHRLSCRAPRPSGGPPVGSRRSPSEICHDASGR